MNDFFKRHTRRKMQRLNLLTLVIVVASCGAGFIHPVLLVFPGLFTMVYLMVLANNWIERGDIV